MKVERPGKATAVTLPSISKGQWYYCKMVDSRMDSMDEWNSIKDDVVSL